MKNSIRPLTFVLTLVLMLGLVSTSFAQYDECFGMGAEDCDLYYSLSYGAEMPSSAAFGLDFEMAASVEDASMNEEFEMALFFDGAYVVDEEAIDMAVKEFGATPLLDVSAGTFLDLMRGTVSGFDAELSVDYEFPAEFGVPPVGPVTVWLVDGVGYIDLAPFAAFDPSLEGVYGVNLFDLIEVPLQQVRMSDIMAAFEGMGGTGYDPEARNALEGLGENPFSNFMPAMMTPEDVMSFVTMERVEDANIDGRDVAVFVTTVDLSAMMESEAVAAVAYQSAMQSGMPDSISEADFSAAFAEALDGTVVVTESLDLETGLNLQTTMEADLTMDIAPIAEMAGEQEEGTVTMTMVWDFALSDIDNVDAIEVPADAEIIPAEALLGGM